MPYPTDLGPPLIFERRTGLEIRAADLKVGDRLTGSGFVVTAAPRAQGKHVVLNGYYPGRPDLTHTWGASTTVRVERGA